MHEAEEQREVDASRLIAWPDDVTRVSQECYIGVPRASQGCHRGVTRLLQRLLQRLHKGVTGM
jgi:hypothetical protein